MRGLKSISYERFQMIRYFVGWGLARDIYEAKLLLMKACRAVTSRSMALQSGVLISKRHRILAMNSDEW